MKNECVPIFVRFSRPSTGTQLTCNLNVPLNWLKADGSLTSMAQSHFGIVYGQYSPGAWRFEGQVGQPVDWAVADDSFEIDYIEEE